MYPIRVVEAHSDIFYLSDIVRESERSYEGGAIALYALWKGEPITQGEGIAVNLTREADDETGTRIGKLIVGISSLDWNTITAVHDVEPGLLVTLAVRYFDPENDKFVDETLRIRINPESGTVTLEDSSCSLDKEDWSASGSLHGASEDADWKISVQGKVGVDDAESEVTLLPAEQQPDPHVFVLILTVLKKTAESSGKCVKLDVSYSDEEWRPAPAPVDVRVECGEKSLTLEIGWDV